MSTTAERDAMQPATEGAAMEPESEARPAERTPSWAEKVVRWLDDGVRIPGTQFRFGLDPIIGFFLPGAGDAITGTGSASLFVLAIKERVPTVALLRMVVNVVIDVVVGAIPVVGDLFDAVWKSNRKNLDIIEKYRTDPKANPTAVDYVLVTVGFVFIALSVALPFIVLGVLGAGLVELFSGQ